MALFDISEVTSSLIQLLTQAFKTSPAWTAPTGPPNILPEPPARITQEGIGIYLYHVQEKKEYGSFPVPGGNTPPVKYLPTALNLYYQVSANSPISEAANSGAINEQLMMSIAIKAFHDNPTLDDGSTIIGPPFFPAGMRGRKNKFNITPLPINYSDAVHNWTAGTASMKLSAYYEVSPVFLEPEETSAYSGRVLAYGNFVLAGGAPLILNSQSVFKFTLPGETTAREVNVQPGQGAPGQSITLYGAGFTADTVDLRIFPPGSPDALLADNAWGVNIIAENKVMFTVQNKALKESNGLLTDLFPGIYSAQLLTTRNMVSNGISRQIKSVSNQFPFVLMPAITVGLPAGNIVPVSGFTFANPGIMEIYLNQTKLIKNSGGAFAPGEFRINSASNLDIHLPATAGSGQVFPVRVVIGGAESGPAWIVLP